MVEGTGAPRSTEGARRTHSLAGGDGSSGRRDSRLYTFRVTLASPPATPEPRTHQALYRRWRAQTFGEIVGQEATVQTLRNAVRTGQVAHALLFVGPRGTGKTSMARIV